MEKLNSYKWLFEVCGGCLSFKYTPNREKKHYLEIYVLH